MKRRITDIRSSYTKFRKQQEYLSRLDMMLELYRAYGFNSVEFLKYILRKLGYKMYVTPKGIIRLKRFWVLKDDGPER